MNIPNIFLIGFMGSGKSHWGRIWAKKLGRIFCDLDQEVEEAFDMSVEKIFEKHGEEKFRQLEKYHLRKNENKSNLLIACGGGTPCYFDNMDWMLNNGVVIYLKATDKYILGKVIDETEKRPLIKKINKSELLFYIQKKLKEREPVYKKANYTLPANGLNENTLDNILKETTDVPGPKGAGHNKAGKKVKIENA